MIAQEEKGCIYQHFGHNRCRKQGSDQVYKGCGQCHLGKKENSVSHPCGSEILVAPEAEIVIDKEIRRAGAKSCNDGGGGNSRCLSQGKDQKQKPEEQDIQNRTGKRAESKFQRSAIDPDGIHDGSEM